MDDIRIDSGEFTISGPLPLLMIFRDVPHFILLILAQGLGMAIATTARRLKHKSKTHFPQIGSAIPTCLAIQGQYEFVPRRQGTSRFRSRKPLTQRVPI